MEKAIIVGVDTGEDKDFDRSMKELAGLAEACEMEVVEVMVQNLTSANKATFIGQGKVQELKEDVTIHEVDIVVFDNSLSPSQLRNLQDDIGCAVMDRSALILEIFSRRAKSREAKLQVEVASLQYMLPRLVGLHAALSRQGGGSGAMSNKGSGEKQLELDRRYLERRLTHLKKELEEVEKNRKIQRARRENSGIIRVALVGYTNAGKSTLMNAFIKKYTSSEYLDSEKLVYEENMLFATLDTTVRRVNIKGHTPILLSDTVGFIDKLPHNLVKAFGSTLEEAAEADVILHVIDDSDEYVSEHIEVTTRTLSELGAGGIPTIIVHNKCDLSDKVPGTVAIHSDTTHIYISAKSESGIDELVNEIEYLIGVKECTLIIPYDKGNIVSTLTQSGSVTSTEYLSEGTKITAKLSNADIGRYNEYIC